MAKKVTLITQDRLEQKIKQLGERLQNRFENRTELDVGIYSIFCEGKVFNYSVNKNDGCIGPPWKATFSSSKTFDMKKHPQVLAYTLLDDQIKGIAFESTTIYDTLLHMAIPIEVQNDPRTGSPRAHAFELPQGLGDRKIHYLVI